LPRIAGKSLATGRSAARGESGSRTREAGGGRVEAGCALLSLLLRRCPCTIRPTATAPTSEP
jgi:hypothetical protein